MTFEILQKMMQQGKTRKVLGALLNQHSNRIVKPYKEDLNHAWYLVGVAYYKEKRYEEALLAFKNSYRHWRFDVDALRAIGNCYSELRNAKMAKYYFIKAKNLAGKEYEGINALIYNLGNSYFDLGQYRLAISEFKKVKASDAKSYEFAQKNMKLAQTTINLHNSKRSS